MLVEFFGVPGSGKSTMSRIVADALRHKRCVVSEATYDVEHQHSRTGSQLLKLGHIAAYAASHPRHALSDAARIAATRQATVRDLAKSIFNWTFISSLAARERSRQDVLLLDQGVAQALWSVGFAARGHTWLELIEAQAPALRPDLVIHVRADLQAVGNRLMRRERHASRMDDRCRDQRALQRAAEQARAVLAKLRAADVPVIEVDNSDRGQLAAGARAAADAVLSILIERGTAAGERSRQGVPSASRGAAQARHVQLEVAAIARRRDLDRHGVRGRDEGCRP